MNTSTGGEFLFKRALGDSFDAMPLPVRSLHRLQGVTAFEGIAQVDPATNGVGWLIARLFRFPGPARDVPVRVSIKPLPGREIWCRRFGAAGFTSVVGLDGRTGLLTETFGLLTFSMSVKAHEHGLDMSIVKGRLGFVQLPRFLYPRTRAQERVDAAGRFTFDVEIGLKGVGRLVRYRGWLLKA